MTTRTVEGGFISADVYPEDGEPDWKQRATDMEHLAVFHEGDALKWRTHARGADAEVMRLRLALADIENMVTGVRGKPAQKVRNAAKRALGKLG